MFLCFVFGVLFTFFLRVFFNVGEMGRGWWKGGNGRGRRDEVGGGEGMPGGGGGRVAYVLVSARLLLVVEIV